MPSQLSLGRVVFFLTLLNSTLAQYKALSYVGCYKTSNGLTVAEKTYQYQSDGHCQEVCISNNNNAPVLGLTNGDSCLCGSQTPATSDKVDDSNCNMGCTGYGQHMCGGSGFYSVYLTGTQDSVSSVGGGTTTGGNTKGPTSASSTPSVITSVAPGRTVVITQSAAAGQQDSSATSAKGSNTTAVVAGVVVGIVAVCALAGGVYYFLRFRRRRAAEEEYKQRQVAEFMGGKAQIPASRKVSGPDSRFDAEAMAHRRLSDGSIADNEDYSRRILKVTNPDDR